MIRPRRLAYRIVLICMALSGAACLGPWRVMATPLTSHQTYTNVTYGYAIDYPVTWQRAKLKHVHFAAFSPDRQAFITANATQGTLSLEQIQTAQRAALGLLGSVQGHITYALKSVHGLAFQMAEALVKSKAGNLLDVILLDSVQHGALYDFNAGVVMNTPASQGETIALRHSLRRSRCGTA
jgi:hypothetical protein